MVNSRVLSLTWKTNLCVSRFLKKFPNLAIITVRYSIRCYPLRIFTTALSGYASYGHDVSQINLEPCSIHSCRCCRPCAASTMYIQPTITRYVPIVINRRRRDGAVQYLPTFHPQCFTHNCVEEKC